jgi:hypothetical protein
MTIPEENVHRVVRLLLADIHATIGANHEQIVQSNALRLRGFVFEESDLRERLVADVQQQIHDEFIDTTWPECPLHTRHPMWFKDDGWWCEQDGVLLARLGELGC